MKWCELGEVSACKVPVLCMFWGAPTGCCPTGCLPSPVSSGGETDVSLRRRWQQGRRGAVFLVIPSLKKNNCFLHSQGQLSLVGGGWGRWMKSSCRWVFCLLSQFMWKDHWKTIKGILGIACSIMRLTSLETTAIILEFLNIGALFAQYFYVVPSLHAT